MGRRLIVLALIAAVVGLGVFWVVTVPATVPASALAPHTANLDNGKVMCWGENDRGQIGDGTSGNDRPTPTFVQF